MSDYSHYSGNDDMPAISLLQRRFPLYVSAVLCAVLAMIPPVAAAGKSIRLQFLEQEPSLAEPYVTRMLVTPQYLRIDDGDDHGDYVLFDRDSRAIYSVSHEERRILEIRPREIGIRPPEPFVHEVREADAGDVPPVGGVQVRLFRYSTNGTLCYEVYAAPGLLDDARLALAGMAHTLAGEHAVTVPLMPEELRSDCDLADYVFVPDRHLGAGFPVRSRDAQGRLRQLQDYDEAYAVDDGLFLLPSDYQRYQP